MLQSIKKFLPKWLKFLLFDLSWDAIKIWVGSHITIIVPTAAISLIGQSMLKNIYSCLDSPFYCLISNYSEILLVIGLILIPLSIIINKREIEKKFSELNQKILSDKQAQHHKISDDLKKKLKLL